MTRLPTTLLLSLLAFGCSGPEPVLDEPDTNATTEARVDAAEAPTPEPQNNGDQMPADDDADVPAREIATFGGGCFWCTEAVLEQVDGVIDVESGYMGGDVDDPTYRQVCTGTTNHAEVVQVTFDPTVISYESLLEWFFQSHDPTTLNRQGADVGTQYRSVVFFHSKQQEAKTRAVIERIKPEHDEPIVTEVSPAVTFWPAEAYHQDYYRNNKQQGYCRAVIAPKLKKLDLDVDPKK